MAAVEQLKAMMALEDPFVAGPDEFGDAQLQALRDRLAQCREGIGVLERRADDLGVTSVDSAADVVGLLFAHQTYKSYPDAWVADSRWPLMNRWLDTLSTGTVSGMDVEGVHDTDDWIRRLRDHGHHVAVSSGTTGKTSFLNRTASDRRFVVDNILKAMELTLGLREDRPVFLLGPRSGSHDFIDVMHGIGSRFGREGAVHWLSQEPLSEAENRRQGELRRRLADGSAKPSEIQAIEQTSRAREAHMREAMGELADRLVERQGEPVLLIGFWLSHFLLMEEARKRGLRDGALHPDSGVLVGGGVKGARLPEDHREQIERFHGLAPARYFRVYGMAEMSSPFFWCAADRYHCPP